jgi:hypothetical protein
MPTPEATTTVAAQPRPVEGGYFEIIEMATASLGSITGKAITHVNGVPPCGANLTDAQALADALPLGGGLFGSKRCSTSTPVPTTPLTRRHSTTSTRSGMSTTSPAPLCRT